MAFSPLIETAIEIATQWHDGTYRKMGWREAPFAVPDGEEIRVPVAAHVTCVAMAVARTGWDDATVAAAFLHDVLEDRNRFRGHLTPDTLRTLVGSDVLEIVEDVTEQRRDASGRPLHWEPRKSGYIERLRRASDRAVAVSLADKHHNLWTINQSLSRDLPVFESAPGRRALSAGPRAQRWFHLAVLELSEDRDDPRLDALRLALRTEIEQFESLTD